MAVLRDANWASQQRVDLPHLRLLDSSIRRDFDLLAGSIMAGQQALVVTGFDAIPPLAGSAATSLQMNVASAIILHPQASESGTIFQVPSDRPIEVFNASNPRLTGSFTANTTNYIGMDLRRTADSSTADLVEFLDPDTNLENPKTVPLGRTLDYVFLISTQDFSTLPGIAPLVKVVTDVANNIVSIEDAREFFFRLGSGGTIPNPQHAFPWPNGRTEIGDNSDFQAGDKSIHSLKDWVDAAMTRFQDIGGGEHWYSATADRNVRMVATGSTFSNGEWFEWDGTNLHWKDLFFVFDNSTGHSNEVFAQTIDQPGLTDLADGECIYVDLDRTQDLSGGNSLQPVKAVMNTLGTPLVPGSRWIIAWRVGTQVYSRDSTFAVNSTFFVATTTALGIVKLHQASLTPLAPVVLSDGDLDTANGVVALNANKQATIASTAGSNLTIKHAVGVNSPVLKTTDSANNQREVIDQTGYMNMGRITSFEENWLGPDYNYISVAGTPKQILSNLSNKSPLSWILGANGGGSEGFSATINIDSSIGRYAQIGLVNSGGGQANNNNRSNIWTINSIIPIMSQSVVTAEWEAKILSSGPSGGFTNAIPYWGLTDTPTFPFSTATNSVLFMANAQGADSTFWRVRACAVAGGGTTDLNTTVNWTLDTWFRFRMEIHGSATPVGIAAGGTRCIFYINDASVAFITKNVIGPMWWVFGAQSVDQVGVNNGDAFVLSGPLLVKWNRFANTLL